MRRNSFKRDPFTRRLRCEPLEDRRMLSIGGYPDLPGMVLVEPVENQFEGQVVYLDFDGAEDVTYNGPVVVDDIDVPAFEAPGELAGQEQEIIAYETSRILDLENEEIAYTQNKRDALDEVTNSIAQIIDVQCSTASVARETTQNVIVSIQNNDTSTRTYWVGLSFKNEQSGDWPDKWYDIPPKPVTLYANKVGDVEFEFEIPFWLTKGQYEVVAAIWDGYDASSDLMIGERHDDLTVNSFLLEEDPSVAELNGRRVYAPQDIRSLSTPYSFVQSITWDDGNTYSGMRFDIEATSPLYGGDGRLKLSLGADSDSNFAKFLGGNGDTMSQLLITLPEGVEIVGGISTNIDGSLREWQQVGLDIIASSFTVVGMGGGIVVPVGIGSLPMEYLRDAGITLGQFVAKTVLKKTVQTASEWGFVEITNAFYTDQIPVNIQQSDGVTFLAIQFDSEMWGQDIVEFSSLDVSFDIRYGQTSDPIIVTPDMRYSLKGMPMSSKIGPITSYFSAISRISEYRQQFNIYPSASLSELDTITTSSGSHGDIVDSNGTVITSVQVSKGDGYTFYADPDAGYVVDEWFMDGSVIARGVSSISFDQFAADAAIHVTFKLSNNCADLIPINFTVNQGTSAVTVDAGDAVNINVMVVNSSTATATSEASSTGLYLSTDQNITVEDTLITKFSFPAFAPGAGSGRASMVSIPSDTLSGTYYIGAVVDCLNEVSEGDGEYNNVSDVIKLTINGESPPPPLLVVDTLADENDGNYSTGNLSLREAIALAADRFKYPGADEITFSSSLFSPGIQAKITLQGTQLDITSDVIIRGPASDILVIDAGNSSRVFYINEGVSATMEAFTITGGNASDDGGGVFNNNGTLSLSNMAVTDNVADGRGGGIFHTGGYCAGYGKLDIANSIFSGNSAGNGGAIYNLGGELTLEDSDICGNSADSGGGISVVGVTIPAVLNKASATINNSTISDNIASSVGGGLHTDGSSFNSVVTVTVDHSHVFNNSANSGGGIWNNGSTYTIADSTVMDNSAAGDGGGIWNAARPLTILDSKISGNSAENDGGGIYNVNTLILSDSEISSNTAGNDGGGINNFASLTATNSTISYNTAANKGGALYNGYGMSGDRLFVSSIADSSITNNVATEGRGAGIYNASELALTNSTISDNSSGHRGGGIYNVNKLDILESFIADNSATGGFGAGGGIYNSTGQAGDTSITGMLEMANTIVSGNSSSVAAGGICNLDGYVKIANSAIVNNSTGFFGGAIENDPGTLDIVNSTIAGNIVTNKEFDGAAGIHAPSGGMTLKNTILALNTAQGDAADIKGLLDAESTNNLITLNPVFVDPTNGDYSLKYNSPAVDAGNNALAVDADGNPLLTDCMGNQRISGSSVDIGAYEFHGTSPLCTFRFTPLLVFQPTVFDDQDTGEISNLPDSDTWIDEWTPFWAEIWVSTPETDDLAVMSASVDLNYNTAYHTATEIQYGPAFTENQSGTIDDAAGMVGGIGAETLRGDIGDDRYALLARVRFEPTANDDGVPFYIDEAYVESVDNGIVLESPQAALAGGMPCETLLGDAPDTRLCAVPFDLDNDGIVDMNDLVFFAREFKKQPGVNTDSPYAFASDYDRSGVVDMEDFVYFAANYKRSRPSDTITYPGSVHSGLGAVAQANTPATQTTTTTGTSTETQTTAMTGTSTTTTSLVYENRNINDVTLRDVILRSVSADDDEEDARDAVFASIGVEDEAMGLLDE